jgi:Spy/CpxP family protein refolding chaperone
MHRSLFLRAAVLAGLLCLPISVSTADAATQPAAADANPEAAYTWAITQRTDKILETLALTDSAQAAKVHGVIMAQWRALRDWHDTNDVPLKNLAELSRSTDKDQSAPAGEKLAAIRASLKTLHDGYISRLSAELTPAQVEAVKDAMTYNVVKVTVDAYDQFLPQLTAGQRAKIEAELKAAREEAMDQGTSKEKHAVFGRAKGRINNYLSREGYDVGKATKEWEAKQREKKAGKN